MNIKLIIPLGACAALVASHAAPFVNLTFDEPDLSGPFTPVHLGGPQIGKTSQLLRGWTPILNGVAPDTMTYSPVGTSSTGHLTLEENLTSPAGQRTLGYYILFSSSPPNQANFSIKQTGTIPSDAASLGIFANHLLEVRINGDTIYTVDPEITAYPWVDVSRFAGQSVDLEFSVIQFPFQSVGMGFDILGFKPVPEPSTWALFGVGAAAILCVGRRKT
jgi:hypothetical protein